jgi:hypothetical protein
LAEAVIGGWQVAGLGRAYSNYFNLPTSIYPTGAPVQFYGHKYRIEDCRGGVCQAGYLLYNGYLPAFQINQTNTAGKCIGICGVPSVAPINPYPANYPGGALGRKDSAGVSRPTTNTGGDSPTLLQCRTASFRDSIRRRRE